jgi:DNA-binding MarR family transcriptional regulator
VDRVTVTQGELIAALQAAMEQDEAEGDAVTVSELREALGWSKERLRRELGRLKEAGQIKTVKVMRRDLSDRLNRHPGYRLVKKREESQDEE